MDMLNTKKKPNVLAILIFSIFILKNTNTLASEAACLEFYSSTLWNNIKSVQKLIRVENTQETFLNYSRSSLKIRETIKSRLKESFKNFRFTPDSQDNVTIAINLSPKNILHLASRNMNDSEASQILDFIKKEGILNDLKSMPKWLRNKYFEINLSRSNPEQITIESKFSWQLSIPIVSQLKSGFPYRFTPSVRPLGETISKPMDNVRKDLISQKRSQETLYTCGLSSLAQILNARGIQVTESNILEKMETHGIKTIEELFGSNPGLEFQQFVNLANKLGYEYGFSVEARPFTNEGYTYFKEQIEGASNGKIDVILNYLSTAIGRPGAGHYSPVGGFNKQTSELLMSETNLAMNPAFWAKANSLFRAMKTNQGEASRGYVVIHWN